MKIILEKNNISTQNFMRKCGYAQISNPHKNSEISYAKVLDLSRFYPRFHIYINELEKDKIEINLHLDMKKPSYKGASAHSGEYDGNLVEDEIKRIENIAKKLA